MKRFLFLAALTSADRLYGTSYDYDCIVIGGGTAGTTAAHIIKQHQKKVAIVEKHTSDTITIAQGEIPSKIFIKVASQIYDATTLKPFGLSFNIAQNLDSGAMLAHVKRITLQIQRLHQKELIKQNIPVIYGTASFVDPHTITVGSERLTAEQFIITTGSTAYIPPIEGIESVDVLTIDTFFHQTALPQSIAIIGAGPLGIELAYALARLNIKVTLFCKYKTVLPTFDQELVAILYENMKKLDITLIVQSEVYRVEHDNGAVTIHYKTPLQEGTVSVDKLCIALNRIPCVQELGLHNANVATHADGTIKVDVRMQTSVDHIWAAGEATGSSILFNRSAYYQAKIAAHNSCLSWWDYPLRANIPFAIRALFCDPPLASIGLSEQVARKLYKEQIMVYRSTYDTIDRAYIDSALSGYIKCICNNSGILLGAHIYGKHACELVTMLKLGQKLDEQFTNRSKELYISPSYTELLWNVTEEARLSQKKNSLYSTFEKIQMWIKERLRIV